MQDQKVSQKCYKNTRNEPRFEIAKNECVSLLVDLKASNAYHRVFTSIHFGLLSCKQDCPYSVQGSLETIEMITFHAMKAEWGRHQTQYSHYAREKTVCNKHVRGIKIFGLSASESGCILLFCVFIS